MDSTTRSQLVSMEESARYLRVVQAIKRTILVHTAGLVPAISDWQMKKLAGYHLWSNSMHINQMRLRLKEMRHPNPDRKRDARLDDLDRFLETAPNGSLLFQALYGVLTPSLIEFHDKHVQLLLPVNDAPTLLMLKNIVMEEREQCHQFLDLLEQSTEYVNEVDHHPWLIAFDEAVQSLLSELLLDTAKEGQSIIKDHLSRLSQLGSEQPILPTKKAARPQSFRKVDAYRPEKEERTREEEVLFQFTNYVQEMNAAETIGSTLYELKDMPWEFHFDLARHLWDEVRHSTMGEVRLQELGISLEDIPHGTRGYEGRQHLDPATRFALLTLVIEADSFPTKKVRHQGHVEAGDFLSAQALIYDITDETMHVQYGYKWVPELIKRAGMNVTMDELVQECRELYEKTRPF